MVLEAVGWTVRLAPEEPRAGDDERAPVDGLERCEEMLRPAEASGLRVEPEVPTTTVDTAAATTTAAAKAVRRPLRPGRRAMPA